MYTQYIINSIFLHLIHVTFDTHHMTRNLHYLSVRIWVKDFPNMEKPKQTYEGPKFTFFYTRLRCWNQQFHYYLLQLQQGVVRLDESEFVLAVTKHMV